MRAELPLRRAGRAPARLQPNRLALLLLLGVLLTWLAVVASVLVAARLPGERAGSMVVMFHPALSAEQIIQDVALAGGSLVRPTALGPFWLVHGEEAGLVSRLEAQGALAAFAPALFRPVTLGGCSFIMPPEAMAGG